MQFSISESLRIIDNLDLSLSPPRGEIYDLVEQYGQGTTSTGWSGGYIGSQGGIRTMLQAFMGNYQMAVDRYKREVTKQCYLEGSLRCTDGNIVKGKWLIKGTEVTGKFTPIAVYDSKENKIIHVPDQPEFLKAKIKVTEKDWHTLKLVGPSQLTKRTVYFNPGKKWHIAKEGEYVFGFLHYEGDITLL